VADIQELQESKPDDSMVKLEDLKKLTPEERIRKLKELEQEKRNEIDEARKLITESENEIGREEEIKREIPIPQVKAISIDQLFSKEEKQIFGTKRFADEEENGAEEAEQARLEETVKKAEIKKGLTEEDEEYITKQVEKPTTEFYGRVQDVYKQAKNEIAYEGQMSDETRDQIMHVYVEQKERERRDREGVYNVPAAMEEQFNTAKQLVQNLVDWYRR
jgi:hypothetical protein